MIAAGGMGPTKAKVEAFLALAPPTSATSLKTLLGMFCYYKPLVHHYSDLVAPLNALTSPKTAWDSGTWTAEHQARLDELKRIYTKEDVVLQRVRPDRPLILHTDFSGVGISGVLGQLDDQSREYMCACVSRSLNVHERKYISYKGELLAVVWAIKTLHAYLDCRPFTVVTDHAPLLWLMSTVEGLTAQYARWALALQNYDFDVVHRPGPLHQNADALSRSPRLDDFDGSGARLNEEDDPVPPPPALRVYAGAAWPAFAFQRALSPAALTLAARYADTPVANPLPQVLSVSFAPARSALVVMPVRVACLTALHLQLALATGLPAAAAPSLMELVDSAPDPAEPSIARATLQVRAERPSLRALRPAAALPLRQLGPSAAVVGINTALVQHGVFPTALGGEGVAVLEAPGGLATGLRACLQLGLRVRRYVALCPGAPARAALAACLPALARSYDGLLAPDAWTSAVVPPLSSPAELLQWAISSDGIAACRTHQGQWLILGSWACDNAWPASSYVALVGALQRVARATAAAAPAYLLEGPPCSLAAAEAAGLPLGYPAVLDAVQAGAALHRLGSWYTNVANHSQLSHCLRGLLAPGHVTLAERLPNGWYPAPATVPLPPPYAQLEVPGAPWVALPPSALVPSLPLLRGPDRVPAQPDVAVYAALADVTLLPEHPAVSELLPRVAPTPVYCALLATGLALHRAFLTPHDLHPLPARIVAAAEPSTASPLGGVTWTS
jgi:hypothetical protein